MVITNCYSGFMESTTPFGAALRHYRKKERALTQKKFAEIVGISQAMLSKIEAGLEDGSSKTREFITNYFKVPHSDFLETGRKILQPREPMVFSGKELQETAMKVIRDIMEARGGDVPDTPTDDQEKNNPSNIIDYKDPIKVEHHKTLNKFPNAKEALEMNQLAVEYVEKDPNAIRELIKYIKYQISDIKNNNQEDQGETKDQKKTSNGAK